MRTYARETLYLVGIDARRAVNALTAPGESHQRARESVRPWEAEAIFPWRGHSAHPSFLSADGLFSPCAVLTLVVMVPSPSLSKS